ncbi:hypothetical protein WICMUC_003090 [Wickerhamomyces mucosus]|uniref:WW domain-containing protein n=1 Tax=Wickerhamomyces mucosus TaxID=1378264 RepID=A0A9P8TDF9_9ASCO|nr:hypothetical protein WICMUC_003090 [Wickerhamomyces mucosus]
MKSILISRKKSTSTSSSNSSDNQLKLDTSTGSNIMKFPEVSYPWEVQYDSNLSKYYFVNLITQESQFDHPDEVIKSPTSSNSYNSDNNNNSNYYYDTGINSTGSSPINKTNHGFNLKRTLSPKSLFSHNHDKHSKPNIYNNNHTSGVSTSMNKSYSYSNDNNKYYTNLNLNEDDEDIKEFKKQLQLEMYNYEMERLKN